METTNNARVIAFYLPQYHPTSTNNKWWGTGFTEWTNVAKARKIYPGHYQPKIPADLGFYDLRLPEIREQQAKLAKEAGIYGFCYYHYWFSKDHQELERPFNEVVQSGSPDFPFCLCWANESWYSKFWNKDGSTNKTLIAEQLYNGEADHVEHFYSLLKAFKDDRYIKVEGKLLFLIYNPLQFQDFQGFKKLWNKLAVENGLEGFFFVAQTLREDRICQILSMGYDGVNHCHRLDNIFRFRALHLAISVLKKVFKIPFVIPYRKAIKNVVSKIDFQENVFPTMMPNWDHTPRSLDGGSVLHNASPDLFAKHAKDVLQTTRKKTPDRQIVFLKSWNEWGEGNYMEPDLKYGKGFINALRNALNNYNK